MDISSQNCTALCELLGGTFLFNNADPEIITATLRSDGCSLKEYAAGDIVSAECENEKSLAVVVRGTLSVTKESVLMKNISRGGVYGVATLFAAKDESVYVSVITAKTKAKILFLSEKTVRELIDSDSTVRMNYIGFLSGRIRYLNTKIEEFTAENATEKLKKYLLSLCGDNTEAELPCSLTKLATMLNMGRASLYRSFDELISQGVLVRNNRKIILRT